MLTFVQSYVSAFVWDTIGLVLKKDNTIIKNAPTNAYLCNI